MLYLSRAPLATKGERERERERRLGENRSDRLIESVAGAKAGAEPVVQVARPPSSYRAYHTALLLFLLPLARLCHRLSLLDSR